MSSCDKNKNKKMNKCVKYNFKIMYSVVCTELSYDLSQMK